MPMRSEGSQVEDLTEQVSGATFDALDRHRTVEREANSGREVTGAPTRVGVPLQIGAGSSMPKVTADTPRSARLAGWNPTRRPPRHQPRTIPSALRRPTWLDGDRDPAGWTLMDIEVADDLGAVRNGMTYNREYGTSATFYEKPRRNQFLEGPNEPAVADYMEMSPRHLDFQFQWAALVFRRADGRTIRRFPDVIIEYDDNDVAFGEIKTSLAWFEAPGVKRPLDAIDRAMVSSGLKPLLRIRGEAFRSEAALEAHAAAMDGRLTAYDPEGDVRRVRETVRAGGGRVGHGALVDALGGAKADAADKLHAMLLRRVVAFELSAPPTRDTPVTLPRPARAHALRELLERLRRRRAA